MLKCWSLYKLVVYFQQGHCPTSNKSVACPRQDSMSPLAGLMLSCLGHATYMWLVCTHTCMHACVNLIVLLGRWLCDTCTNLTGLLLALMYVVPHEFPLVTVTKRWPLYRSHATTCIASLTIATSHVQEGCARACVRSVCVCVCVVNYSYSPAPLIW